jgi:hypothetical protein
MRFQIKAIAENPISEEPPMVEATVSLECFVSGSKVVFDTIQYSDEIEKVISERYIEDNKNRGEDNAIVV